MGLFGIAVEYCQRVSLSVAIVVMVAPVNTTANHTFHGSCPLPTGSLDEELINKARTHAKGEFQWNKEMQGIVLGAFFWGYAATNIIGGRLSEYVGGKMVFGLGIMGSSLLSIISPTLANASVELFIVGRILLGVFQVGSTDHVTQRHLLNFVQTNISRIYILV
ncbi:hypothetical protein SK128_021599 [Halocaridina rubra]|uniref:Major facilitator superfamily (MFS) profile domain-containing protein n=1 Tax=Halocaridina rubra TaxID=373956 RepID=A0AAN8X7H5_HALRR